MCLFSPFINFKIPQFDLLPKAYFDDTKASKISFVQAIQISAVKGLAFSIELLLLRSFNVIYNEVRSVVKVEDEHLQTFQFFYLSLYKAAQKNFHQKFNVKKVDWEKRPKGVKDAMQSWRRKGQPPPEMRTNRYARDLIKQVEEGKVKISSLGIIQSTSTPKTTAAAVSTVTRNDGDNSSAIASSSKGNGVNGLATKKIKEKEKDEGQGTRERVGVKAITKAKSSLKGKSDARSNTFNKNRNLEGANSSDNLQDDEMIIN